MAISERNLQIVESIEKAFTDYLAGRSNESRLQLSLSKLLTALEVRGGSDMHFDIWITSKHKQPSFFMCVTPEDSKLEYIAKSLGNCEDSMEKLVDHWNRIDHWVVEIEAEILNPREINFTAKELTAMLLHEVGHVIYSNSVPERIYNSFQMAKMRMLKLKDYKKVTLFYRFLTVPINMACAVTSTVVKRGTKLEFEADAYVMQYGNEYAQALVSALDKVVRTYGTSTVHDEAYNQKMLNQELDWALLSIKEAIARSGKIKNELAFRAARAERRTMKALCIRIMDAFGVSFKDSYTNAPIEMAMESFDNVFQGGVQLPPTVALEYAVGSFFGTTLNAIKAIDASDDMKAIEAFLMKKKGNKNLKSLLPAQYDIDAIQIEIDRIKTHQDRIFVLDLIYNKMEDLTVLKEAMEHDANLKRKYEVDVDRMLARLATMRDSVLKKNNLDKKYKLWVQVPAGYEG